MYFSLCYETISVAFMIRDNSFHYIFSSGLYLIALLAADRTYKDLNALLIWVLQFFRQ